MEESKKNLEDDIKESEFHAVREMHYGRLEWLAEHIRRSSYKISPIVAMKILVMLEGGEPHCFFELKAVRRADLPPRSEDPQLRLIRDMDMAIEVARKGGFERRGHLARVCHEVGKKHGLTSSYVAKRIRPHRKEAIAIVAEENTAEAYARGEVDFLGHPKCP